MSVVNGLYYSQLRSAVGFTVTGTTIYATLPWYPNSLVDEIRVTNTAGTAFTVSTMSILDNGAHYRNSTADGKAHTLYRDTTDKNAIADQSFWTSWNLNPSVFHENLYNRPYLNVSFVLSESKSNLPLRVTAVGKRALPTSYVKADGTAVEILDDYRVLIGRAQGGTAGTGGTIFDLTGCAIGNGGENESEFKLTLATDYVYVGSKKKIDHWEFQVGLGASAPATLSGELWSGFGWSAFSVIDDTSSGNSDSMKFSGIVEGSGLGSSIWQQAIFRPTDNIQLPNDPLTALQDRIIAGSYPITLLPPNPERYWVRFKLSTIPAGTGVVFNKILPISERYETFG